MNTRRYLKIALAAWAVSPLWARADGPRYRATILWDSSTDDTVAQMVNRSGSSAGYLYDQSGATPVRAFAATRDGAVAPIAVPSAFESTADAINDRGAIAGTFFLGPQYNSARRLYRYTPQTGCVDLGVLGGPRGGVADMNNRGDIVGTWLDSDQNARVFMFTDADGWRALSEPSNVAQSAPVDINERGEVVGNLWRYQDGYRAWYWFNGVQTDLGDIGGNETRVYYISNRGVAVGQAQAADGTWHAFRWTLAEGMTPMPEFPGVTESKAVWITDSGLIGGVQHVGDQFDSGYRAFIHSDADGLIDLGVEVGSDWDVPVAMNEAGVAVFATLDVSAYEFTPYVYSPEDGLHELNSVIEDFPYLLHQVTGVNACGEITAVAWNVPNGAIPQSLSVLLTPIRSGDLDGDSQVNLADFARLQARYGTTVAVGAEGDLDADGDVDGADVTLFVASLRAPCR